LKRGAEKHRKREAEGIEQVGNGESVLELFTTSCRTASGVCNSAI